MAIAAIAIGAFSTGCLPSFPEQPDAEAPADAAPDGSSGGSSMGPADARADGTLPPGVDAASKDGASGTMDGAPAPADGAPPPTDAPVSTASNDASDASDAGSTSNPPACATLEAGTPCTGTDDASAHVCSAGQCVACNAGGDCSDPSTPCIRKAYSCNSGSAQCEAVGKVSDGTACGDAGLEFCNAGACSACEVGASCVPASNACHNGKVTACTGGSPTCTDQDTLAAAGTSCGPGAVCDGSGNCTDCSPNAQCNPVSNTCQTGVQSCASGPQCTNATNTNEGEVCGAAGSGDICHSGACVACDPSSCATGCCDATYGCVLQAAQSTTKCGMGVAGGACGSCAGPSAGTGAASCAGNNCGISCSGATSLACGGACVAPKTDSNNCGSCGNVCHSPQTCENGACACPSSADPDLCNGACTNKQTDINNCGSCGNVCPIACNSGTCLKATSLSAGDTSGICAVLSDGTVRCWGTIYTASANLSGTAAATPTPVPGIASGATAVANDGYATCAIVAGGALACWGDDFNGELGDGISCDPNNGCGSAYETQATPVKGLGSAIAVAEDGSGMAGAGACAIVSGGLVYCWGASDFLGNNSTDIAAESTPVQATIAHATAIAAYAGGMCALVANGTVSCWGANGVGELGEGTETQTPAAVPTQVPGLSGVTALAGGGLTMCALLNTGAVDCWGEDIQHLASVAFLPSPTPVTGLSALTPIGLSVSGDLACVLNSDGTVWCWGDLGAQQDVVTPTEIVGVSKAVQVAAGGNFACALLSNGAVSCWGDNSTGEMGNGTITVNPQASAALVQW
jgi:hypothetical protein